MSAGSAPIPSLQERAEFALVNTPPGADGVRRIVPLLGRAGKDVYFSLSLAALLRYWKVDPADVRVRLGDAIYINAPEVTRRIPIDESGGYFVNYRFGLESSNAYGFSAMLGGWDEAVRTRNVPEGLPNLAGKILLVGQAATGLTDNGPTPFSGHSPLIVVHANVVDNILREDYSSSAPTGWVWLGGVLIGVAGLAVFSDRRLLSQALFSLGMPAIYGAVATYLWIDRSLWLPLVWPLLGFAGLQVFTISRRLIAE